MPTYFNNENVGSIFLGSSFEGRAYLGTTLIAAKKGKFKGLRFTALEDNSTIRMDKIGSNPPSVQLEASIDLGDTWTPFVPGETTIALPHVGDTVFIKAPSGVYNERFCEYDGWKNRNTFNGEGKVSASGNINSIITKSGKVETIVDSCFRNLFNGMTSLVDASSLELPTMNLSRSCYDGMFYGCTSLTTAPELPSTKSADGCYAYMFQNCTSLTQAPELPAMTLADNCYTYMFNGCTSLTTTPELPATELVGTCYNSMFKDCTSLTKAPELPATNVPAWCYGYMFQGCTSLTKSPELPATTVYDAGYGYMFDGCTSLREASDLHAINLGRYSCGYMFQGCTSLVRAPRLPASTISSQGYQYMFNGCTSLTTPPELPATKLDYQSYTNMFRGCTSLTSAPILPATTLTNACYSEMFNGCSSLTQAPELPATTLADYCYNGMFSGCTSLTQAPTLPATTMARDCYHGMFYGCSSLTQAPELPSMDLAYACYYYMFWGCTSLTSAPNLPATALVERCYSNMFDRCSSLDVINIGYEGDFSTTYFYRWVNGTKSSGTFYYNGSDTTRGVSAIPNGWNVFVTSLGYKQFKMIVTKKSSGTALQIGNIDFADGNGNRYSYPSGTTTSVENLTPYQNEGSDNLIDGTTNTKLCANIESMPCSITINLNLNALSLVNYPIYRWWTANDSVDSRSPVSWQFLGSNDNTNWVVLDEVNDFSTSGIPTKSIAYEGMIG